MLAVLRIARRELVEAWRSRTVPVFGALIVVLSLISLGAGWTRYWALAEDQQAAQTEARRQWLTQGEKNPHGAGHFGSFAFKTLPPLALLDRGLDQYLGQWIRLETHAQHEADGRPAQETTALVRFGELTPAFLLQSLGPLFVILLGFGAISREREQGTLTLLLAQGVRPWTVAAGKLLGHVVAVTPLLLPLAVVGVLALVHPGFGQDAPARVALLALAFAAYFVAFAALAVGVSSMTRNSGLALTILMTIWLAACVLVPRVTVLAVERLRPLPSSIEFLTDYDAARGNQFVVGWGGFNSFNEVFDRVQRRLFAEYGVDRAEALPVDTFGYALEETERMGQRAYDETYGRNQRVIEQQEAVHRTTRLASPLMAVRAVTMGLTGTGLDEHMHFVETAESYRRAMMNALNMDIAHNARDPNYDVRLRNRAEYVRGLDLWERIQDYRYTPLAVGAVLERHRADLLVLGGWLCVAMAFMTVGVRRACRRP